MITLTLSLLLVTITPSQNLTALFVRYSDPLPSRICIQTEGKVDDKYNPGDFLPWYAESCWPPYLRFETYRLRAGSLRYRICADTYEVDCAPWVILRPEESEMTPLDPSRPLPGIQSFPK